MDINIDERVEMAKANFASGYNCAQSVALTYADLLCVDPNLMATISAPFGGGLGRMREVCGAVSGMSIVAGFIAPASDPADRAAKAANYSVVKSLAEQFREVNGSIVCRELLGLVPCATVQGKKRPCAELVEMAARMVGEELQRSYKG